MLISIIVPCYNEEAVLPLFLREIRLIEEKMHSDYGCAFELRYIFAILTYHSRKLAVVKEITTYIWLDF